MSQTDFHHDDPERRRQLIEALEVCRAGRDDPSDPVFGPLAGELAAGGELAAVHERLGRLDRVLGQVFADVPVPEGLAERILDRLARSPVDRVADAAAAAEPLASVRPRASRRRFLSGVAAAIGCSAVAIVAFVMLRPQAITEAAILEEAVADFDAAVVHLAEPVPAVPPAFLRNHPPSPDVVQSPGMRWRRLDDFLGRSGVAYELSGWAGARATLYVVEHAQAVDTLGNAPPLKPQWTTGGRAAAAWQADGLLYVLVVEGDGRTYDALLNRGRPLA